MLGIPAIEKMSGDAVEAAVGELVNQSLDPADWASFRGQAHRMLDDMLDYLQNIRQRSVWQPIPDEVRSRFKSHVPVAPSALAQVHEEFMQSVLPFAVGNTHPGFMGWVHGGGTPVGMLAEMLASGLNANVGGRDQIPVEIERQITRWMCEIFGFPQSATGLFVTGTSMANFISVVVARDVAFGFEVRRRGVTEEHKKLTAYASRAVHGCIGRAMDFAGLGSNALRMIATDNRGRMDLESLADAIAADRAEGYTPFLVVGTAGTVDTGAIDKLNEVADLCGHEKLWFHIDGAYGALAMLAPDLRSKLQGIERADSLAFDFHKWGQVPYDAGFILMRDGALHRNAFATSSAYLCREDRGMAAGSPWPCDFGPDLSRSFRALKTWFTLKTYGTAAIGASISHTCKLASYLERRISETAELELLAPVELNVVCFRYRVEDAERVNRQIVIELQESGTVAPSTTVLNGELAIRVAIVNHRTGQEEIDALLDSTLAIGRGLRHSAVQVQATPSRLASMGGLLQVSRDVMLNYLSIQIKCHPDEVDLRFQRANLLAQMDRRLESITGFQEVLERHPSHRQARAALGRLLSAAGDHANARQLYIEGLERDPADCESRVSLGNLLMESNELCGARQHFEEVLKIDPDHASAHAGMYHTLKKLGEEQRTEWHRRKGFQNRYLFQVPYCGDAQPISVLLLISSTGGIAPLDRFLDNRIFKTDIVVADFYDLRIPLPKHQLVVNAIGDADNANKALSAAESLLAYTSAPVVNRPSLVLPTGRCGNAQRLSAVPGVLTPQMAILPRELLVSAQAEIALTRRGFQFPILLRAPGFHMGDHFLRVDCAETLSTAVEEIPGQELIVMQYLDVRSPDGQVRKYRVMMIDGQLYPLHLAISNHWKVHYFSANMAERADNRAEDAAFLSDMPNVLGYTAMTALRQVQTTLGLDYGGIDFSLNSRGEIVVFEANATMLVQPPNADQRWDYRRPAVARIYNAVRTMLMSKASLLSRSHWNGKSRNVAFTSRERGPKLTSREGEDNRR
jgi:aromatic-L-amino-acid/L-tryptophan decarboxylase